MRTGTPCSIAAEAYSTSVTVLVLALLLAAILLGMYVTGIASMLPAPVLP